MDYLAEEVPKCGILLRTVIDNSAP